MTFEEWLEEIEVYSSRMERLMDDINSPDPSYNDMILKWLRAAYEVGYEQGTNKDCMKRGEFSNE